MAQAEEWRPGSFTKNFSWGDSREGLRQLHQIIRSGFNDTMEDVPRALFRERVAQIQRPDYIAINFFLFNKVHQGEDYIIADELVFQALNFPHSADFDKLGLFAFNFSLVGKWKGASSFQSRPALWAQHYVADRVAQEFNWNTHRVSADDIQAFVRSTLFFGPLFSSLYFLKARPARKSRLIRTRESFKCQFCNRSVSSLFAR